MFWQRVLESSLSSTDLGLRAAIVDRADHAFSDRRQRGGGGGGGSIGWRHAGDFQAGGREEDMPVKVGRRVYRTCSVI